MTEITLVTSMGNDRLVVDAARVSLAKRADQYTDEENARLIAFLARNGHWTPFAHCHATFHVKVPIFVARQLEKHQVGFAWSEVSRRYVDAEPEFWAPKIWRKRAPNVKQGSLAEPVYLTPSPAQACLTCGKPLIYDPDKGQLAAHRAKKRYCDASCAALGWQSRNPHKAKFMRWRAAAKADGVQFTITEDDLDWPDACPYLGIKLNYGKNDRRWDTATIDKIAPALGYVPGNVQIISHRANLMKSDASIEELLAFARSALLRHAGVFAESASNYAEYCQKAADAYRRLLAFGVAPEQARAVLPQSVMTEIVWTGSLAAWARFYGLRTAPDAQDETGEVARLIGLTMAELFPVSWAALTSGPTGS